MSDSEKYGDSRHRSSSRRDRSERRRDRDSSSRRSSPGPSRGHSSDRDEDELPLEFGRAKPNIDEDDTTVIKRMSTAFDLTPLRALTDHLKVEKSIIKVWTRNFNEIRGVSTGTLKVFDKHWNIVMENVEEQYIKPKKTKTPYLLDSKIGDSFPELQPKVPKEKKKKNPEENVENKEAQKPVQELTEEQLELKKKRRERRKQRQYHKRNLSISMIRGDNIVMVAVITGKDKPLDDKLLLGRPCY
ncbi:hypothetical protein TNCT_609501 [Trichonephila clavata]|uniref:Sm domain-containing protein n=1 Tax=Trichonephila clavata TaxID=2740835 RepID=A0A8X6FCF3_TRICU|nr:hypothetical protein TNCT_609501 [Trichonephila clavata]